MEARYCQWWNPWCKSLKDVGNILVAVGTTVVAVSTVVDTLKKPEVVEMKAVKEDK